MSLGIADVREWQTVLDLKTGRKTDRTHPELNRLRQVLARHPYPGDLNAEGNRWVTDTALDLLKQHESEFVFLAYAQHYFCSRFVVLSQEEKAGLYAGVFREIERFKRESGFQALVIGTGDLQPMKKRVWEDPNSDLRFEYNSFIQRLSIDADVLFGSGSAELSPKGRQLLDSVRPSILESAYPLGLAGHTAGGRDELGPDYLTPAGQALDFSWRLSLDRVLAVYRYFIDSGVPADKLRLEAFGRYRPKAGDSTPADRKANRRVDITLDKRVGSWAPAVASEVQKARENAPDTKKTFRVRDYIFRLDPQE